MTIKHCSSCGLAMYSPDLDRNENYESICIQCYMDLELQGYREGEVLGFCRLIPTLNGHYLYHLRTPKRSLHIVTNV